MAKTVIFAVAGSGKTTHLVNNLALDRRSLVLTYTEANRVNLRAKIIDRFGCIPPNIHLQTYFSFLHGFCYRPFLRSEKRTKGVTFELPDERRRYALTDDRRFMTASRRLYANRLAKLLGQTGTTPLVIARIEKYVDDLFVDEVQDFAGHDFNFLLDISRAKVRCIFVGDFFQHTYDTSRDGNVNPRLHDNYEKYRALFSAKGINVDLETLSRSHRCSKSVSKFISERLGVQIQSHSERETNVALTESADEVNAIYQRTDIVKLFYSEHYRYGCFSQNWGASKGQDDYTDVCVVLSPANLAAWKSGKLGGINESTRNKLYVACSRARGDLIFVPERLLKPYKLQK